MSATISVVMPARNAERFIREALDRQAKHVPGGDAIRRRWRLRSWRVGAMPLFDAARSRKPSAHVVV